MDGLEKLRTGNKVVGTRKLLKALEARKVSQVYLASDADLFIVRQVRAAADQANVRIIEAQSMKQLGQACGIEVSAAAAGLLI